MHPILSIDSPAILSPLIIPEFGVRTIVLSKATTKTDISLPRTLMLRHRHSVFLLRPDLDFRSYDSEAYKIRADAIYAHCLVRHGYELAPVNEDESYDFSEFVTPLTVTKGETGPANVQEISISMLSNSSHEIFPDTATAIEFSEGTMIAVEVGNQIGLLTLQHAKGGAKFDATITTVYKPEVEKECRLYFPMTNWRARIPICNICY